jgi:hypothetical protein
VNRSVKLDGEAPLGTAEVENKRADRMLAPELQTIEPAITQRLPENRFGERLVDA